MFKIVSNTDHPGGWSITRSVGLAVKQVALRQEECDYSFNNAQIVITLDDCVVSAEAKWRAEMDKSQALCRLNKQEPYISPFDGRVK